MDIRTYLPMRRPVVGLLGIAVLALSLGRASAPTRVQAAADPSVVGQWGSAINWPSVGVHAMLLNNGKVMTWGHATARRVRPGHWQHHDRSESVCQPGLW